MRHQHLFVLCMGALLFATIPASAQVSNDNEDGVYKVNQQQSRYNQFVPGQVIVKFKDEKPLKVNCVKGRFVSSSSSSFDGVLKQFGVKSMDKLYPKAVHKASSLLRHAKAPDGSIISETNQDQVFQIKIASQRPDSTTMLVEALKKLDMVDYAEPNYIAYITSDKEDATNVEIAKTEDAKAPSASEVICPDPGSNPLYDLQYGLTYEGLPTLWTKPIINNKRPVIAIIDTGVDIDHPDLKDNIWTNQIEAEGEEGYDNDNNGYASDVHGWDFINNSPNIRDYNSHGTHCAGIAAACDNGKGVVGANPKALIMPVTVMQSDGTGDYATIARGIQYAVDEWG